MLFQIKTINGQKTIVPLTADTGTGAPVGSIIVVCSNILPSGYLGLGVQYDITNYPALYQVLGTDTTPTASALGLPTLTSGQYAIKATSGLTENQQENVLNAINENNRYSTTEHATGATWIDGKPIYRKVIDCGAMPNNTTKNVAHGISNIGKVVRSEGYSNNNAGSQIPVPYVSDIPLSIWVNNTNIVIQTSGDYTAYVNTYITLEYTKTTD